MAEGGEPLAAGASFLISSFSGARVSSVAPASPADRAGVVPGDVLLRVDGEVLHDILDWRWFSADDSIEVEYRSGKGGGDGFRTDGSFDSFNFLESDFCSAASPAGFPKGTTKHVILERTPGEDWGIDFEEALFDGVRECRNACSFCFMRQLPAHARASLTLRDDDFRLSFLQGTFVTLTNLSAEDEARIISQAISPLRVSFHAVSAELRRELIGRHASHGFAACERLLEAGIEMHLQIVLVPGVNDGEELDKTLAWAAAHSNVVNVGIVPLGFTRYQTKFDRSYDDPASARAVIEQVRPYQEESIARYGRPRVYLADEFYRNAYPENLLEVLPPAEHYGDYELFEDGIGIIRSFVDDWRGSAVEQQVLAELLKAVGRKAHLVIGEAQIEFLLPLLEQSPLAGLLVPLPVKNRYFGGNVDVTGLLCGCDVVNELRKYREKLQETHEETLRETHQEIDRAFIPSVIFNADGITLDDMSLEEMERQTGFPLEMVSCIASEYFRQIAESYRLRG